MQKLHLFLEDILCSKRSLLIKKAINCSVIRIFSFKFNSEYFIEY